MPNTPVLAGLKAVDWAGSLLIIGSALMVLLGLEFGGITFPWSSAAVICLITFGTVALGIFLLNECQYKSSCSFSVDRLSILGCSRMHHFKTRRRSLTHTREAGDKSRSPAALVLEHLDSGSLSCLRLQFFCLNRSFLLPPPLFAVSARGQCLGIWASPPSPHCVQLPCCCLYRGFHSKDGNIPSDHVRSPGTPHAWFWVIHEPRVREEHH